MRRHRLRFAGRSQGAAAQDGHPVHNPHENVGETYSGVPLIELLKQVGAPVGKDVHGKALAEYIVATGSDGYKAVLALAEIEPDFHPGDVLVADTMNGKPMDAKTGPSGWLCRMISGPRGRCEIWFRWS